MKEGLSRRGLVGWVVVFAAIFVWLIVIGYWYGPRPTLDLADRTDILIALWWTIVCGICVFIGMRIEKVKVTE